MSRAKSAAKSPEEQQDRCIAYAVALAEKQLEEGTASQQVILHYLKLADTKERLRSEKLEGEIKLLQAKVDSIEASKRADELYEQAIAAMKAYAVHE